MSIKVVSCKVEFENGFIFRFSMQADFDLAPEFTNPNFRNSDYVEKNAFISYCINDTQSNRGWEMTNFWACDYTDNYDKIAKLIFENFIKNRYLKDTEKFNYEIKIEN